MRTAILLQALLALSPALARASAPCTLAAGSLEVDVVADCGAAADGVHDDTEALARAADTLAALLSRGEHRGALYFPAGTYLTSRRITLIEPAGGHWAGVLVRGDGSSRSVIKARGAQGALLVELVQRPMIARIEIRSLGFLADGPGLGPAVEAAADGHGKFSGRSLVVKDAAVSGASPGSGFSDGVRNRLMYRTLLDRVSVTGVSGACFDLEDIYSPTLKDSRCSDARTGLRFTGNNPEGLFVTGNEFSKVDAGILVELQGMEPEMMISGNRIRSRKSGVVVMGKKLFSIAENAFSQEGEDSGYEDIRIGAGPSQPKVMKGIVSSNAFLPGAAEGRTMIRVLPGAKFVTVVKNSFSSTGTAVAFESRDQGVQILKVRKSSSGVETVSVTPPESCRAGPKTPFAYRSGPGCRLQDPPDGLDDVVPPALSDPAAAQVSSVSASLSWATGEPSDTRVEYGTSTAYGLLTERLEALTTAHLLVLEGLTPGTTYYWRALSDDEAGNSGLLAGPAFRTLAVRPELALGSAFGWIIRGESASLTWSSTGTVSCAASGAWGGAKAPRGSQSVSPVADSTYTLTCAGPGGSVARSVFVEVLSFSPRKLPTPEKAPLAMTFWGFTGVNGADEWEKRLEEQAPYAAIHAPATCASPRGCAAIAKVHARYPDKPVTYQAAWGGTVGIDKDAVWPGHWLYKAGTRLSRDVSADDTVLRVENPGRILKHMGEPVIDALPYGVMLYALDGRGRPDWSRAEHVVLKSRNADGTLSVERGRFGTAARAFKANEAVAAAHMYYWTNQWQLNLSMHCPRGGPGDLTAGEWYAREMARNLILADADGLEFDVARWTFGSPGNNTMDADNDLAADYGYIDGVNSFGIGGELFLRKLRALVGPDRFLQADGNSVMGGVRGWQYLNGVQLESFPRENDFDLFSEAFTHLRQWASEAGAAPRFSYGFTKTPTSRYSGDYLTGPSGNKVSTDFRFRVGLAAACMAGMPHPFRSLSDIACDPENPSDCAPNGEQQGIFKWDEYFGGTLNDWRWLGEPLGPARQDLGNLGKDLLSGAGWGWVVESGFRASHGDSGGIFFADVSGVPPNRHASELYSGVRLEPSRAPALVPGREYTAVFDARGDDSWTYRGESFDRLPRGVSVDGRIRSESGKRPSVPADSRWRTYRLSFTASTAAAQTPSFGVSEQIGRTELRGMRLLEGGAERWSREFSGGLVLLNMTREPWTAPLATGAFRRIQATLPPVPGVPEVNTGGRLGASVTVPARDAVFLVRTKALAISLASPDPLRGTAEVRAELRGTTAAARVEFAVDEVLRSSDSKAPYAWSWDTLEVADGTHTLSATAHCADGAQASTSAVVRVDNGPMTASVLSPSAGSSLKGVVSVKARASGPAPVESVEFVVDGRVRGVAAAAPYAWAWDTRLDKNGAHTLKVRSADAFGRSAAASVQVSVSNPEPSGPIAVSLSGGSGGQSNGETFLGANNLYWVDDDAAWSEKGMGALLGRLRFKTLRYPGGTAADNYDWENHRLERPDEFPYEAKTEAERLARLDFKEFLANARAAGVKDIFFVANVWGAFASTGSENANIRLHAEKAARWVKAVRDAGYHVPYWEIGNELYLGGHRLTAGRYADVLRAYYPRMKAADPSIRIGAIGPNEPDAVGGADEEARSSDRWWDVVAREAKGNFDFMATHRYRSARMREEGVVFEGPLTLKDEIGALKAYVSARAGSPIELALTEWNTPGGANDRMTDMEHALDIAEQLGNYSQGGVAHAEYWPFHIGGARFPVAAFNTMKPKSTFRLFEIFGEIRRDGACGADYDPRSGIYALCTRAGGEYGLWLVNRTDSAKTAVFSRPGKTLSLKSARVLTADGDDAVKVSTASASEAGESARVVLPPRSVGAVELYEGFGEVRLTAYPDAVAAGRGVRLRWESSGAASCEASGAWSGRRAASGSETVTPAAGSTYTLTCTLSGVTRSRSAFVEVLRMEDRELRLPDTFPVAMTFGAGGGISDAEFTLMLEKFAPYQVLHAPGGRDKAPRTRERWPEKPLTLQMAYGGANQGDFGRAWPGHWLYKVGTRLAKDAGPEDEIIFVEDPSRINGRIPKSTDTIPFGLILYPLDKDGKPDWDRAEHLVLTQRLAGGGLKVRRGAWGSVARSFKAGKAVAASHMLFWTNQWQLNLSLDCPRGGPQDLTAAEWYAQEVAKRVIESKSDGVEFDVGRWTWGFPEDAPMDIDNDLVPEYGYLGGVNSFGLGGQVLFRELRDQLGPNKIIQADSNDANFGVRGWKYLSGIQIECFPATDRFSEAFSHLRSWVENAGGGTRFSYPFTKAPTTTFSGDRNADGSSTDFRFRVGLAAACLTGMPHPFNSIDKIDFDPANPSDDETVVRRGPFAWDENFGGELKDWKWLGRPLGPARQDLSAMDPADLLAGASWKWAVDAGFSASNSEASGVYSSDVRRVPAGVIPKGDYWFGSRLEPAGGGPVLVPGREYTLEFEASGDDDWTYGGRRFERVPRSVSIRGPFLDNAKRPISVLADSRWRSYRISLTAGTEAVNGPVFGVSEQVGSTRLRAIRLHKGSAERWSREFERGLVLLNWTDRPWEVPLAAGAYRRLKGTQDPGVNDGRRLGARVVVPAKDALFLVKSDVPAEPAFSVDLFSPGPAAVLRGTVPVEARVSGSTAVLRVEFLVDGALESADAGEPFLWTWDTRGVANGTHTLAARAFDALGARASTSAVVSVDNPSLAWIPPGPTAFYIGRPAAAGRFLDDQTARFIAGRGGMLTLSGMYSSAAPAYGFQNDVLRMKRLAPALPVFFYTYASLYDQDWTVRTNAVQAKALQGYRDLGGLLLGSTDALIYGDVRKEGYRDWLAGRAAEMRDETRARGVSFDLARRVRCFKDLCDADAHYREAYGSGMDALFDAVRSTLSSGLVQMNGLWTFEPGMLQDQERLLEHADSSIVEYFGYQTNQGGILRSFQEGVLDYHEAARRHPDKVIAYFARGPWYSTATYMGYREDYLWQRYLYGAYLLGAAPNTLFKYHSSFQATSSLGRANGLDVYADGDLDLGAPLKPYSLENGLYVREFRKGLVLVAPHDGAAKQSKSLAGAYYDPEGSSVSGTLTLQRGSARILLKSKPAAPKPALVDFEGADAPGSDWEWARLAAESGDRFIRLSKAPAGSEEEHDLLLDPVRRLEPDPALRMRVRTSDPAAKILAYAEVDDAQRRQHRGVIVELSSAARGGPARAGEGSDYRIAMGEASRFETVIHPAPAPLAEGGWKEYELNGPAIIDAGGRFKFRRWMFLRPAGAMDLDDVEVGKPRVQLSLSADRVEVSSGQRVLLTWSSTGAASCLASGAWTGARALDGGETVAPAKSSTYTLACSGPGGRAEKSAFVAVTRFPPAAHSADWMRAGQIGLSSHYSASSPDQLEAKARALRVGEIAGQVSRAGASRYQFILHHQSKLMMAPNAAYDAILGRGGYASSRDVPLELYDALEERGIRLMLYVNLRFDPKSACPALVREKMGGWPPNDTLVKNLASVYREYSLRYGKRVSGWWVDGVQAGSEWGKSPDRERYFREIAEALRAGNPDAVVAFNPGLEMIRYSAENDFIAGESDDIGPLPAGPSLDGAQWHLWTFLGGWWGSGGKRFSDQELLEYARQTVSTGGALTLEVGTMGIVKRDKNDPGIVISTDAGRIDPAQVE